MNNAEDQVQAQPIRLPSKSLGVALAIGLLAWLAPGAGHLILGRWIRALILMTAVLGMFMLGIAMDGKLYDTAVEQPLHIFAFIANLGVGLPYFLAQIWEMGIGEMTATTFDYGTTFLWTSGLLNYLVVMDGFDIARGRKP
jgi:hypothetical protein